MIFNCIYNDGPAFFYDVNPDDPRLRLVDLSTGKGYDAEDAHAYIRARIAGEKLAKPRVKSWRE